MKKNIREIISTIKVDCALFTDLKEIFYLTGASFGGFWFLAVKGKNYAFCSKMIENQTREFFAGTEVRVCSGLPLYMNVLKVLKENKTDRLFIDPEYMQALDFILITENLMQAGIKVDRKIGILDAARAVKEDAEIINLKKACEITSEVCNIIKMELIVGVSELDIYYRILELFAKNHVSESFPPIVAFGRNSSNPHHSSSNDKLNQDDIAVIDIGCTFNGYCSDLTRTYFLGRIDNKRKVVWDTVKRSHEEVLKGIKAGMPVSWADKTARGFIRSAGYSDKFTHTTGHGVGIEIHEMPSLSLDAEGVFLSGMTVTVEPGIYISQEFGVRIEDTILIEKDGCRVLTSAVY
ncbi:MAG: M24 family metallopeptidase [Endomicrobium sp.]|nr:M24 family metallopeptidase [Endomicrobium sp.]